MKRILIAATLAATAATPALAEETGAPSGPRVEVLVGYDNVRFDGIEPDGAMYGLGAGYDYSFGNFSAGVDAEVSDSTTHDDSFGVDIKSGRDLYAGGRLSLSIAENANVYVKGGYTNARFKADGVGGENLDGWRFGLGTQINVMGKFYTGAEYRYSNYEADVTRHQLALNFGTRF